MHAKRDAIILLTAFILLLTVTPSFMPKSDDVSRYDTGEDSMFQDINEMNNGGFTISQATHDGIIDPVSILQSAYQTTEITKARSDTGTNTEGNISIDEANGWFVNSTSIDVSNLRRLYAVNGTFDEGVDPWTNYSVDGGSNTQIHSYNSTGGFIVSRNVGQWNPAFGGSYIHSAGSEVGWSQVASNTPAALNFRLDFDFRYLTGPLDPQGDDGFSGDVGVFWELQSDGGFYEGWYYPLENGALVASRETWYSVTQDYTLSTPDSELTLAVGLYFAGDVRVYNQDYNGDGSNDGWENAQNVTVCIDNVEFTSTASPDFSDVGLTFHAGSLSTPINGTGTGTATLSNPSFWDTTPLEYQITASANVAFTYSITSLFQRNINSSWTTSLSNEGVQYSVTSEQSSDLTFYTYITQPSGYYDSTFDIHYPKDWENTTIWDPLLNNITTNCDIASGWIHVPTSELSRSGWWEINLNSLNYAKNVSVQVYNPGSGLWQENSLFRPSNDTRVQANIGTSSATPIEGDPVNITWVLPNDIIWTTDSITTMLSGAVTSSTWTFGSSNTTAGEWSIEILWTNGTEIAFRKASFDLYHSASIVATYPLIETDYGLTISNLITFKDADTDEYLLDDSVTIEANWSSSVIPFAQNYAKKWWEADFETSLISEGRFVVLVNASKPYFDDVSTQFVVIAMQQTTFEILNAGAIPIDRGLNEVFTVQMEYDLLNGTGVSGASIYVSHSGPGGGLSWNNFVDNSNGHYSVDIVCDISATYPITITLNKTYYHGASDSFTLIIEKTGTALELINGTSDVVRYGDSYRLVMQYRNSTGGGLEAASFNVVSVTPVSGLMYTAFTDIGNGYYEITLTPSETGTYSVVISASLFNHETQYVTFTITSVVIPTILTSLPTSTTVSVNQSFVLQLLFQDEDLSPIDSANITVLNPPSGIMISSATSVGGGLFNITLQSAQISVYNLLFRASAENYQSSITGFTISVTAIPTTMELLNAGAIPVESGLKEIFTLQLSYQLLNGTGVRGALPTIIFTGPQEGLQWTNFIDNNNGLYSLDITCNVSAIYGITVTLSKMYHYNTSKSFTLIIGETGSELQILNGTVDVVLFGNSYVLVVEYRNSTGSGLSGADLQVLTITPPSGLNHDNFSHIVDGYYQITFTPTAAGSFSIVISASIINHETQYATFTLTATGIPTILTSLPSSASTALDQDFTVQLRFQDDNLNPLDLADFNVTITPSGLTISDVVRIGSGLYNFTLTPSELGTFTVLFRSSLENYQSSSTAFTLIVTKIPTVIVFEGDVSSVRVGFEQNYQLVIYYYRIDIGTPVNVDGANISVITQDPGLEIGASESLGYYVITIRGHATGTWSLTISANKANHHGATKQFLFTVEKIPISVEILEGHGGLELMPTTLRVNITETDTGNPVSGLSVFYRIIIGTPSGFAEDPVALAESSTPGIYEATITMPDADENYYVQISCEAENYVLDALPPVHLAITRSFTTALMLYSTRYWWAILGLVAIVGAVGYRRTARRRRVKQNKIALAVKKRFEDVRNLLGVIVLHKDSGLPVYSKILREGLEESVISAFISAITSFRGEFDIETTTEEWGLIPISDIVRVISTNKLICAFITTGNPSAEQREKMIQFAKTVGFIFDETMEDVPVVILDQHTTRQFNSLFDDILDGALLRTYKLDEEKKFPTSTCADERIARKQGEEFKLEELASEISACGLEEGRVYQAIMKALENHLLVTTDESPYKTEIIRAPDIVEEES